MKGSWHDEYSDSAVIFVGGLDPALTEGDVITIFSQYGEIIDINLPKHTAQQLERQQRQSGERPETQRSQSNAPSGSQVGKRKGFGFLLFEDQRSTILAVDNLNGSKVLGRTLRVDHVKDYKHLEKDTETGKTREAEQPRANAKPQLQSAEGGPSRSRSLTSPPDIDAEDPMASYFANQKKARRRGRSDDEDESDTDTAGRPHRSSVVAAAEREAKRQRKEERAKIRAEREQRRANRRNDEKETSPDQADRAGHRPRNGESPTRSNRRESRLDREDLQSRDRQPRERRHGEEHDRRDRDDRRDNYSDDRDRRKDGYRSRVDKHGSRNDISHDRSRY